MCIKVFMCILVFRCFYLGVNVWCLYGVFYSFGSFFIYLHLFHLFLFRFLFFYLICLFIKVLVNIVNGQKKKEDLGYPFKLPQKDRYCPGVKHYNLWGSVTL